MKISPLFFFQSHWLTTLFILCALPLFSEMPTHLPSTPIDPPSLFSTQPNTENSRLPLVDLPLNLKESLRQRTSFFTFVAKLPFSHLSGRRRPFPKAPLPWKPSLDIYALSFERNVFFTPSSFTKKKEPSFTPLYESLSLTSTSSALLKFDVTFQRQYAFNLLREKTECLHLPLEPLKKRPVNQKQKVLLKGDQGIFFEMRPFVRLSPIKKKLPEVNPCLSIPILKSFSFNPPLSCLFSKRISAHSKEILGTYTKKNAAFIAPIPLAHSHSKPTLSLCETKLLNQSHRISSTFLQKTLSPFLLNTLTYDQAFKPILYYSKRDDGPGYFFCIKIDLKDKLPSFARPRHFTFVIDRSSRIQMRRFPIFKEGTQKALAHLKDGDSFNLLIADKQLSALSVAPIPWNQYSTSQAKQFFLEENSQKTLAKMGPLDLLSDLSKGLSPDLERHVILMTDGHFLKSIHEHPEKLEALMKDNGRLFSLFVATASQNNALPILDLLSTFNKGTLMHSKTNAAFPRQLILLIKRIQSLIAKDLQIHAIQGEEKAKIELYPKTKGLPSLYENVPYFIYGTIDQPKDFNLIFQAHTAEGTWIHIKETLSFKTAQKMPQHIQTQIDRQKAYRAYEFFLETHQPLPLKEGERLLNKSFSHPPSKRS